MRDVVVIEGLEVPYELTGTGHPVVLIHGLGGSQRLWRRLQDRLSAQFLVVAYDLRGSGESRELGGSPPELSLSLWAHDLRGLLRSLDLERPALVGHSLGASIALKFALSCPDELSSLILMGADPELSRIAPRMRKATDLISRLGMEEWVEQHWTLNTPFSRASLERDPSILDEYRAMVLANDRDEYIRTCLAVAESETMTGDLRRVTHPCLVIVGSEDDRTLPSAGRELAESMSSASFVELPGIGHTMPLEAPEAVAEAITAFLVPEPFAQLDEAKGLER